jgi:transposase-like protein
LGWLFAQDDESLQRLNLDRIHCQSRDSDSIALATPFWRFIKQGLIHYQGGFRHHFFQYLREMEFRYNDRQKQRGPDICLHVLAAE